MGLRDRLAKYGQTQIAKGHVKDIDNFETGLVIDYLNGSFNKETFKIKTGFTLGKFILLLGKSGSGKTTLGIHMVKSILSAVETVAYHYDFEKGGNFERLINFIPSDIREYYIYLNDDLNREKFFTDMKNLKTEIHANKKEYTINSPWEDGKKIVVPTPVLIDSLITMKSKKIADDDEMSGQMQGGRNAAEQNRMFEELLDPMFAANITGIGINHLRDNISTTNIPPSSLLKHLSNKINVPGGKGQLQFSDTILMLTAKATLTPEKNGINGFMNEVKIIKSRSNAGGNKINVVFDQYNGFDVPMTDLQMLRDSKLIGGGGAYQYVKGFDTIKFNSKTYRKLYTENNEFKDNIGRVLAWEKVKLALPPELRIEGSITDSDKEKILKINFPKLFA